MFVMLRKQKSVAWTDCVIKLRRTTFLRSNGNKLLKRVYNYAITRASLVNSFMFQIQLTKAPPHLRINLNIIPTMHLVWQNLETV